jgi:integrase
MRVFKRGRIYYCHVYENGERRQRSTRCCDKKAAETVARQLERDGADPDHAAARTATLKDAIALTLRQFGELVKAGKKSRATLSFHEKKAGHWSRLLEHNARGEHVPFPLAQLRARHVDAYISQRRLEGAQETTIAKELTTLRVVLKRAKRAGLWRGDIAEVLPVAFAPEYSPRERWLPRDELAKLLAQLVPDRAARVAFIVATSSSWGESDRAERTDVVGNQVAIRGTKRSTRRRVVPVVLEDHRSLLAYALEHAGGQRPRLFAEWTNVRHDLRRACRRAGIAPCSPNDLRRTHSRWLRAAGAPPDLISPAMGHADTRMVERVYGRLEADELAVRLTIATSNGVELLMAQLGIRALVATLELCSAGASDRGDSLGPAGLAGSQSAAITATSVPRDGIEPPTRGFSSRAEAWPRPREHWAAGRPEGVAASPVHHRRRIAG